ncbi:MAG: FadR/GntR family transcriptional regulator [Thermaerobacter sp.]|nr:FadR/GntR family transcriptional regulator [Thermaerobacter sp.]
MVSKPLLTKRSSQVAEYLEALITQNVYHSGDKLPSLHEMAKLLKASQSTIREALAALQAQDLIDARHGIGYFVKPTARVAEDFWHARDLGEVLFVRTLLEVPAAALAAQNRTADDLEHLREFLELMPAASGKEAIAADLAFHLAVGEATKNRALHDVIQSMAPQMRETMRMSRAIAGTHSALYHKHLALYDAIANRQCQQAAQSMHDHLHDTAERLKILVPQSWAIGPALRSLAEWRGVSACSDEDR